MTQTAEGRPEDGICADCKNHNVYVVNEQRKRLCIVNAEHFAPDDAITACNFFVEVGTPSGERHYT